MNPAPTVSEIPFDALVTFLVLLIYHATDERES